ncbi:MAG: LVIVD repeat-containing protein [Actinomycetota bacterium]
MALRRLFLPALVTVLALALPAVPAPTSPVHLGPLELAQNFQLVGHVPLMNRGMNAALAVKGNYAYVGSRTDAKPWGTTLNLNHAGVMVVDVSDPASPHVVNEIGPPNEANEGETSRELRIWPQQNLLIVENLGSNCSDIIHECSPRIVNDNFRFYDISGANAAAPKLVSTYMPSASPHEFYLWADPFIPDRALMFISSPATGRLLVTDISGARQGTFRELGSQSRMVPSGNLHSLSLSNDGFRGYMAHLTGGFFVTDTSEYINDVASPRTRLVTPAANRVSWPGPGAHSAIKLYGQPYALVTDEVYGVLLQAVNGGGHGCPWGWVRMIDISDPTKPKVVAEYKLPQNDPNFCTTDPPRVSSSWASHNPTLTPDLAFITWHSGGLQAISLKDPTHPIQTGVYSPDPLPAVLQEDPALSAGQDKVVMWSYPVIKDGLIYVVDVRNGLYILRYTGEGAADVSKIGFLEGNSNLGDALLFDPPNPCARNPVPPGYEAQCVTG